MTSVQKVLSLNPSWYSLECHDIKSVEVARLFSRLMGGKKVSVFHYDCIPVEFRLTPR